MSEKPFIASELRSFTANPDANRPSEFCLFCMGLCVAAGHFRPLGGAYELAINV